MLRNPPKVTQLISNEPSGHQPRSVCSLTLKACNDACALNTTPYPHRHDFVVHKTTLTVPAQVISVGMPSFRWGFQLQMLKSFQGRHRSRRSFHSSCGHLFTRLLVTHFIYTCDCTHLYCQKNPLGGKSNIVLYL